MKRLFPVLALVLIATPVLVLADVVPCGDPGQPKCQTCHVYQLVSNVVDWFFGIAATVAAILIAYGGLLIVISNGNASLQQRGRSFISAAIIGFIMILSAWFIIDFTIGVLTGTEDDASIFEPLQCVEQPDPETLDT